MNSRRDWRRREAEEMDGEAVEIVKSMRLLRLEKLEPGYLRGYE